MIKEIIIGARYKCHNTNRSYADWVNGKTVIVKDVGNGYAIVSFDRQELLKDNNVGINWDYENCELEISVFKKAFNILKFICYPDE